MAPTVVRSTVHSLKMPEADDEWRVYHEIRRTALFVERGMAASDYNPKHPDDRKPGNTPFLLLHDERPVGTVRIDLPDGRDHAIVRMVAVSSAERNQGHGARMLALVEAFSREQGRRRLVLNAAPAAVNFYRKNGFMPQVWDEEELKFSPIPVQMVKILG